jgi:hypothetical protein
MYYTMLWWIFRNAVKSDDDGKSVDLRGTALASVSTIHQLQPSEARDRNGEHTVIHQRPESDDPRYHHVETEHQQRHSALSTSDAHPDTQVINYFGSFSSALARISTTRQISVKRLSLHILPSHFIGLISPMILSVAHC